MGNKLSSMEGSRKAGDGGSTYAVSSSNRLEKQSDIWLRVWTHITDVNDIRAVTLVCKEFQRYAQPLLFHDLHVKGPHTAYGWENEEGFGDKKPIMERLMKLRRRIKFLGQEQNSKLRNGVRQIFVYDWSYDSFWGFNVLATDVLTILFQVLPGFTSVRTAYFGDVRLTAQNYKTIAELPLLSRLYLFACPTISPGHSLPFQVQHLRLDAILPANTAAWVYLIHPQHLKTLRIDGESVSEQLLPHFAESPPFLKLTSVELVLPRSNPNLSSFLLPFLVLCPSLTTLSLDNDDGSPIDLSPLPPTALLHLNTFTGPAETAVTLVVGRPISTITLIGPHTTREHLQPLLRGAVPLYSLSFTAPDVTFSLMGAIGSFFPQLRELHFDAPLSHGQTVRSVVAKVISAPTEDSPDATADEIKLPSRLEVLRLVHGDLDGQPGEVMRWQTEIVNALAKRYPSLLQVQFTTRMFWSKLSDGTWATKFFKRAA